MQRTRAIRKRISKTALIFPIVCVVLLALFITADQVAKNYVETIHASDGWQTTTVIEGFFNFTYIQPNKGAAYGIFANLPWGPTFLKVITFVALAGFVFFFVLGVKRGYKTLMLAVTFIVAGAVGNLIDRLVSDGVTDFLELLINGVRPFGVFNIADVFITVGVILFIVHYFFLDKDALFKKRVKDKKAAPETGEAKAENPPENNQTENDNTIEGNVALTGENKGE